MLMPLLPLQVITQETNRCGRLLLEKLRALQVCGTPVLSLSSFRLHEETSQRGDVNFLAVRRFDCKQVTVNAKKVLHGCSSLAVVIPATLSVVGTLVSWWPLSTCS